VLTSVTSTGDPIATVQIHAGGGAAFFGVDTVTFTTAAAVIPVANARPTREAEVGHLVALNGSKSYDPTPPRPLTFLRTQVSGPAVTLSGATTATPTFRSSVAGVYVFSLVVSDGQSSSKPATVKVFVEPGDGG
jgi:hypothetical protein